MVDMKERTVRFHRRETKQENKHGQQTEWAMHGVREKVGSKGDREKTKRDGQEAGKRTKKSKERRNRGTKRTSGAKDSAWPKWQSNKGTRNPGGEPLGWRGSEKGVGEKGIEEPQALSVPRGQHTLWNANGHLVFCPEFLVHSGSLFSVAAYVCVCVYP